MPNHNASPAFADPATESGREQRHVLLKDDTGRGSQLLAYIDYKSNWVGLSYRLHASRP